MATESEIDRILTDLADLVEGDTLDEFQATALLQAQTILQSLRSQAGVSGAVAWRWHDGVAWDITQLEDTAHYAREKGFDVQPLYARPAPIEITEEMVERAAAAYWWENYGRHRPAGKNHWPDDVIGGSQELFRTGARAALTAALQGETK